LLGAKADAVSEANSFGCWLGFKRFNSLVSDGLGNAIGEALVNSSVNRELSGFDFWRLDISEMACDVADVVVLGSVVKYLGPERTRLLKVKLSYLSSP